MTPAHPRVMSTATVPSKHNSPFRQPESQTTHTEIGMTLQTMTPPAHTPYPGHARRGREHAAEAPEQRLP